MIEGLVIFKKIRKPISLCECPLFSSVPLTWSMSHGQLIIVWSMGRQWPDSAIQWDRISSIPPWCSPCSSRHKRGRSVDPIPFIDPPRTEYSSLTPPLFDYYLPRWLWHAYQSSGNAHFSPPPSLLNINTRVTVSVAEPCLVLYTSNGAF